MTNTTKAITLILLTVALTACSTTTATLATGASIATRVISSVTGGDADRAALCDYYAQHRAEVDAVREYARANWQSVPEEYKPSLLAINEQLIACEALTADAPRTRRLYTALRKAVALYRELHAAGVI